ncbi:hypothetical protein C8N47_105153 [Mangrovibacterium marinum]|uniref:Uncharacterized protein n=1 Tax=Mangrovibacterium marinum TaxID=1639118 RepID=A0A2T5C3F3_9BACT|nr:hypothetical protein [Mangrovibacterium marinum]PTN09312.1 hypothetical protein C8N47_105153 [Mangrovibacterium marinum]
MSARKSINIESGWICLYRSLAQSPLWLTETFTRGQAWVDLLVLANYSDGFIRVRGSKIDVKRGQLGWSMLKLAGRWDWSRDKVKRFFNELEKEGKITQQNSKLTSIITINNYEYYQNSNQQTNNKQSTGMHKTNTNNKNNKQNKVNKGEYDSIPPAPDEVISFFNESKSSKDEAEKFFNHYTSQGWKIGHNPMVDWKAAGKKWIQRCPDFAQKKQSNKPSKFLSHDSDF